MQVQSIEPPDGDDALELSPDQAVQIAMDCDQQHRLWLGAALTFLKYWPQILEPNPRVQLALDKAKIAVLERVARAFRQDLGPDQR